VIVGRYAKGDYTFLLNDFWFTSGFLLLILLSLIDQPHFSTDSNIFINSITGAISLLLINQESRDWIFITFLSGCGYLAISSLVIIWLRDKPLIHETRILQFLSRLNRQIGRPEAIFSAFFLWGALNQFGANSHQFNALLLFWVVFMIINIPAIAILLSALFDPAKKENKTNAIGKVFRVQAKNTFLIKVFTEQKGSFSTFDFVEFKFNLDNDGLVRHGLVIETYVLNEEQWIKVLTDQSITKLFSQTYFENHTIDMVYKIEEFPQGDFLNRYIGLVSENSSIGKIKFYYNPKNPIQEGQLLEVRAGGTSELIYYQVVEGLTKFEQLEEKNENGFIIGEAIQLGTWDKDKVRFEKFGWVPNINSPLLKAGEIEPVKLDDGEFQIGHIPNSNFPVIINKELALTHHTAVLGVTGTGKSVFSRNLIREHLKEDDVKVICIDFTGEYKNKFDDLKPVDVISSAVAEQAFKDIDWIERTVSSNYGKDNDATIAKRKEVSILIHKEIEEFIKNPDARISIFELPDVNNTSGILEYTRLFFKLLFYVAKKDGLFGKKVCLVLEEAHTVIPEWNFVGIADKSSQSLLNSIAQIALQGRKYNVGLLVIAQRTANVSKTVLTQCNTIIAFQEFDKTSSEFLANYFGQGIANTLPNLKFRQAIAAGKALKSNVPMIFEVPEINEIQKS
jgi:hypothetical protein